MVWLERGKAIEGRRWLLGVVKPLLSVDKLTDGHQI